MGPQGLELGPGGPGEVEVTTLGGDSDLSDEGPAQHAGAVHAANEVGRLGVRSGGRAEVAAMHLRPPTAQLGEADGGPLACVLGGCDRGGRTFVGIVEAADVDQRTALGAHEHVQRHHGRLRADRRGVAVEHAVDDGDGLVAPAHGPVGPRGRQCGVDVGRAGRSAQAVRHERGRLAEPAARGKQ